MAVIRTAKSFLTYKSENNACVFDIQEGGGRSDSTRREQDQGLASLRVMVRTRRKLFRQLAPLAAGPDHVEDRVHTTRKSVSRGRPIRMAPASKAPASCHPPRWRITTTLVCVHSVLSATGLGTRIGRKNKVTTPVAQLRHLRIKRSKRPFVCASHRRNYRKNNPFWQPGGC